MTNEETVPTIGDIYETLNRNQRTMVEFLVGLCVTYDINSEKFRNMMLEDFGVDQLSDIRMAGQNFLVSNGLGLRSL